LIYLDNSATTRVCDQAVDVMSRCMRDMYFNPSASYEKAMAVKAEMERIRTEIAALVHCPGGRVVFTSGGTEADNLAILGALSGCREGRVLYSAGEHPAVKEACKALKGLRAESIPLLRDGTLNLEALSSMLSNDVLLIAVMQVNNETGAVMPLKEIAALRDRLCPDALFHVDGVQGFLRVPMDMKETGADSYALSSHKIHGPKGAGALVAGPRVRLHALLHGGGQEGDLRSGTENTPGILGMGEAIRAFPKENDMRRLKCLLWERLLGLVPGAVVNGPAPDAERSAPHILNVSLPPVRSETMQHALEGDGVLIGIGSACASNKQRISETLSSMGVGRKIAESALRFSLCPYTTEAEIETCAERVGAAYRFLSPYQRR